MTQFQSRGRILKVSLRNYRSIESCAVELGPLTFLVGPNGTGKSNFLDALRLVSDALNNTLDHALRERGGISEVRRRSYGQSSRLGIGIEFELADGRTGFYGFEVGSGKAGGFRVETERCQIGQDGFRVEEGKVTVSSEIVKPAHSEERLYLVAMSGFPSFRAVYDLLTGMGFYNILPTIMRQLGKSGLGEKLEPEGGNVASVLAGLGSEGGGWAKERIGEYLQAIVPEIVGVEPLKLGHMETLQFLQSVDGTGAPQSFVAQSMSDGTLRAVGVLIALFQAHGRSAIPLVGIEEPEMALHPAAAGVLLDALKEASQFVQVVVTSHSADLLDDPDLDGSQILAVGLEGGRTVLTPLSEATRSILEDKLYTAGDLLRRNQIHPRGPAEPPMLLASEPGLYGSVPGAV
jgi:predicted ATPase